VRIIYQRADGNDDLRLARRFARHPHVRHVRLAPAARSLTVEFSPLTTFEQIVNALPADDEIAAPITVIQPTRTRLAGLATLAIEVLAGNPIAIALTLLSPLLNRSTLIR
jgi:hypothetical protein